jgi:NADH:ubiquinone oxidoreductase subunit E
MSEKIRSITICMGSSCFSRGNKKTVGFLRNYLKERKLDETIILKGAHCMGQCDKGPVVKIDEEFIYHVNDADLEVILDKKLGLHDI